MINDKDDMFDKPDVNYDKDCDTDPVSGDEWYRCLLVEDVEQHEWDCGAYAVSTVAELDECVIRFINTFAEEEETNDELIS